MRRATRALAHRCKREVFLVRSRQLALLPPRSNNNSTPTTPQKQLDEDEAAALVAIREANPSSELPEIWRGDASTSWPGIKATTTDEKAEAGGDDGGGSGAGAGVAHVEEL